MSQRPEPLRRLWQWVPPEADDVLLEPLAAVGGVDRGADLGCVAGRAHARNVLLRDNEALCDPHPTYSLDGGPTRQRAARVEA